MKPKYTLRSFLAILALIVALSGCRRPPNYESRGLLKSGPFGDGETILKSVLDAALAGYETQDAEIRWSGHRSSGDRDGTQFAFDDSLIVKNTDVATVADKLSTELSKLPVGHGSAGDSFYEYHKISYEKHGAWFYFDFVLTQREQNVQVLILHKGVQHN